MVFASAERRVPQTRDMFSRANLEFSDVVTVLGLGGQSDACWPPELVDALANAFDGMRESAAR
jgi:hypothetical protein